MWENERVIGIDRTWEWKNWNKMTDGESESKYKWNKLKEIDKSGWKWNRFERKLRKVKKMKEKERNLKKKLS